MESDVTMQITIEVQNEKEQERVANSLHNQLLLNEDYRLNNILMDIEEDNTILIRIFRTCTTNTDIVL